MKNKFLTGAGMVLAGMAVFSCTKKIDEAYQNPNALVEQPIETLMPNIIQNMVVSNTANGTLYGTQRDAQYIGRYIQNFATNSANNAFDQMGGATGSSDAFGDIWAMHYYGQGQNLNRVIEWGTRDQKWDYVGAAHAIRAWSWLTLTDVYGDAVILRDAFNTSLLTFRYDSQQDVYEQVKYHVRQAIDFLNRTGDNVNEANLAKGNQYFSLGGDREKWKKFAYSVMARVFHRTTNKAGYQPDSVLHYANLAINSNADNAYVLFEGNTSIKMSFFGPSRANLGTFRQTRFAADLFNGSNSVFNGAGIDPRAWYKIRENANGTFRGVTPTRGTTGLTTNDIPQNLWGGAGTSTTGTTANARYIWNDAMPWPIITASEIQFLKAEALYRKGQKPEALAAYRNGIALDFDMLTAVPQYGNAVPTARVITPAVRDAYLAQPKVVPAATDLNLSHIMLQKYIALYGYGYVETWVDMRRYHYIDPETNTTRQVYTDFTPPTGGELNPDNLNRLVYRARPRYNSEYLYNIESLNSVGAMNGNSQVLNYHTKEMWFSMY